MRPDSSASVIDRIIAWLRGVFSAGKGATDAAARDVRRTAHEATDDVRRTAHDATSDVRRSAREATGDVRRTAHDATDTVRERAGDAERKVRDIADRRGATSQTSGDRDRGDLPDLADESSGGGRSTFESGTSPRDAAATYSTGTGFSRETDDEAIDQRSDFDDAAGDLVTGDESYPPAGTDLASASHVHDAVGGEDVRADDTIDGTIDTTRDADLRSAGAESLQDREISLQDQLIVDEGASSDEFDGDRITPGNTDNPYVTTEDVESAAEGYGDTENTNLANTSTDGTSTLTGSTYTETDVVVPPAGTEDTGQGSSGDQDATGDLGDSRSFQVVERYNYGEGDLGVGAGTTPDSAWQHDAGPDVTTADIDSGIDADINAARQDAASAASGDAGTGALDSSTDATAIGEVDASVSPDATRTEIESQSRGDAVNRSDEATQTPGFGDPETFDSAAAGTTEPSRSSTGDDLDDGQDALGTTLDETEESDAFNAEAADLSGEDELAVSDENVDFGAERVATFQSGTIAQEGSFAVDEEITDAAYADLPDEPDPATADDAGEDDLAGSDYPSDRIVDTLDGDDFTEAETPDVPDLDSSAGDLDVVSGDPSEQVDYVSEPVERTVGDASDRLDQDMLAATDETVGEDISPLEDSASLDVEEAGAQSLTGAGTTGAADTASGATVSESAPAAGDLAGESDAAGLSAASGAAISGQTSYSTREGKTSVGGAGSAPAGAVPGDGGTEAPEGYPVKGNANSMIYHLPEFPSYRSTKAEFYFATEDDAVAAGYRAPGNVRHGHAAGGAAASAAAAVAEDTGAVTGDETSHAAPGEVAFDEQLSADQGAADASSTADDLLDAAPRDDASADTSGLAAGDSGIEAPVDSGVAEIERAASDADLPAGAVRGDGTADTPDGYPVKGNASSMIYHLPDFPSYRSTKPEFCFATEQDALNAGYRAPANAHRGGHAAGGAASSAASAVDDTEHEELTTSDDASVESERGADSSAVVESTEVSEATDASAGPAGSEAVASEGEIPAGAIRGDGGTEPPEGYPIKGNASSMIYHLPSFPSYKSTKAEFYFASEEDATNAGYRAPGKRSRGKKH